MCNNLKLISYSLISYINVTFLVNVLISWLLLQNSDRYLLMCGLSVLCSQEFEYFIEIF